MKQVVDNVHIYRGGENPIKISRVYSSKFLCDYDMGKYPFDTQTCTIQIILKGNSGNFAQLISDRFRYLGQIDLTQYYLKNWSMGEIETLPGEI